MGIDEMTASLDELDRAAAAVADRALHGRVSVDELVGAALAEIRALRIIVDGIKADLDRYRPLLPDPESIEGRLAARKMARMARRGG